MLRAETQIQEIIDHAITEDLSGGDVTTDALIPGDQQGTASIKVKEKGILAGTGIALKVFHRVDQELKIDIRGNVDEIFNNEIETPLKDATKKVLSELGSATYELGEDKDKGVPVDKIDLGSFENVKGVVETRVSELQDLGANVDTLASKVLEVRGKIEEAGKLFS